VKPLVLEDMVTLIEPKFSGVPGVDTPTVERWINEAVLQHGYTDIESVPDMDKIALINLTMAIACGELAVNAVHFFRWQDGDEMVDKSMIPAQYRQMAQYYMQEYQRSSGGKGGGYKSSWKAIRRADR
jgi:hypothetical protein